MLPVAILCGGKGTRIEPIAGVLPKALIPVAGRRFIDLQLEWLAVSGVRKVVLCVGYRASAIMEYVGEGSRWNLEIVYSHDGDKPLGTGGAILRASPYLGDAFLTLYGDSILQCLPQKVAATLLEGNDDGIMTVYENCNRWSPSNVRVQGGRVTSYDKHAAPGTMTYIDYGLNAFRSGAFRGYTQDRRFDLAAVHRDLIARGSLGALECFERWYEIGSPSALEEAEAFLRSKTWPKLNEV